MKVTVTFTVSAEVYGSCKLYERFANQSKTKKKFGSLGLLSQFAHLHTQN